MYNIVSDRLLSCYKPLKQFWQALLRFGSPRFTVESVREFKQLRAANDDLDTEACGCQLDAA